VVVSECENCAKGLKIAFHMSKKHIHTEQAKIYSFVKQAKLTPAPSYPSNRSLPRAHTPRAVSEWTDRRRMVQEITQDDVVMLDVGGQNSQSLIVGKGRIGKGAGI
jgi:hypothetical protein